MAKRFRLCGLALAALATALLAGMPEAHAQSRSVSLDYDMTNVTSGADTEKGHPWSSYWV